MAPDEKVDETLFTSAPLIDQNNLEVSELGSGMQVAMSDTIITTVNSQNISQEIEEIFIDVFNVAGELGLHSFAQSIHNSKHKLYACRYHLAAVINEINKQKRKMTVNTNPNDNVHFMELDPVLIYETESFLFQVKSCLDILVQTLGKSINSLKTFRTFAHKGDGATRRTGGKVIDHLNRNNEYFLAQTFEKHRVDWIQELTLMRDVITHESDLKGFMCFVSSRKKGRSKGKIHVPMMPNDIPVEDYLGQTYESLITLHKEIANMLKVRLLFTQMKQRGLKDFK